MLYLGDFLSGATVYIPFTTNASDGTRTNLSASLEEADVVVLKNGAAMTLDANSIIISTSLGSRVGFHVVAIDMSIDSDFTTGAEYAAYLYPSDETVDSKAPVGVLATWSCENRTVKALKDGSISAATLASDTITDAKVASDVTIASVTGAVGSVTGAVGSVTGNVGGNVTGSVGSVVGAVGSVTGNVGGNVTGSVGSLATQAKADVNAECDTALADAGVTTTVTGRIDAAVSTRAVAGDAMALTSGERTTLAGVIWTVGNMATAAMKRIADFVLRRNTANAATSTETGLDTVSFRSPIGAIRKLTNKVDTTTNSGKLTVFEEDDTTQAATQTLATDAAAEPITGANTD